jgi:hypothetical protein
VAIPKTVITGKVLLPSGVAPTSGTLTAKLSQSGSALDGAASHRVASSIRAELGSDGALPAGWGLCPNDAIVPSGTFYRVAFALKDDRGVPYSWEEKWQVATAPSPVDIGAVTRLDAVAGAAVAPSIASTQAQADAASASATAAAGSASSSAASALAAQQAAAALLTNIDGGAPDSVWGGTLPAFDGGTP